MTLRYVRLSVLGLFLVVTNMLSAQTLPYSMPQRARLAALGETLRQTRSEAYTRAEAMARTQGRPIAVLRADGSRLQLRGLSATGQLLYDETHSNGRAANTTRTNLLYAGGGLGLSLTGSSAFLQNKLGIWDGGRVRATHRELTGRVTQVDNPSAVDNHATHVAGTMVATGRNGTARGMAFGATLRAWDFSNDNAEMATAAAGLLLSNHSYGTVTGWNFNAERSGSIKWEWYGDTTVSATDDYNFGFYDNEARSFDQIAYNAPYYLIVKSAGNDHGDSGPGAGQPYVLTDHGSRTSTLPRNDQTGYDQISTYGTAKNILTVAAISYLSNGYNQATDVNLASFSSWGPTDDGRIKPDIAGVGVNVLSTGSATDSTYVTLSGTSMATPNVTGSLLLLQELYGQRNNGQAMRSSTLKALAIHTADEAGAAPGPDYRFGWGLLNDAQAARVLLNDAQNHRIEEQTLQTGGAYSVSVVASGRGPLVATICWTDPESTVAGRADLLNNRTPKLVNDLDLRVAGGPQPALPWIMDPANPAAPARTGDNALDNVEQVRIENPVPGQTYTLTISHKNALTNSRQDYALILSGIGGTAYCASAATTNADSKIGRVQLGSLDQRGPDGCTTYTSFLNQTPTNVAAGQVLPLTITTASCGASRTTIAKAFADWNLNGTFTDPDELLATSGPLTTGAVFTANLTAPNSVTNGQLVRLRIVLTETSDAATVSACGPYSAGETQEFLLRVVRPANDVGVAALLAPDSTFCASAGSLPVVVRLRNFGTAAQTNVPVTLRILDAANAELGTVSGTLAALPAFGDGSVTLRTPANVPLNAGQTYRFVAQTGLAVDPNTANNQLSVSRTVASVPTGGVFTAATCGTDTVVTLRNTGSGTAYWYDGSGNLLASGNQAIFRGRSTGGQFSVALDDFGGTLGPVSKSAFTGGTYFGNFGPAPLVTTTVPVLLERARLYIASAGRLTFTVRRFDETPVSSVTLDVLPTRNPALTGTVNSGQLVDDPADPGAEYQLNLRIPTPGEYKITIEYENGASLFRSNQGVTGFPYRLTSRGGTPVISTKGSLSGSDTLRNAWYYLYNLQVKSLGCPSARSAVTVTSGSSLSATIASDGGTAVCEGSAVTLRATSASALSGLSYQWLRNDQPIAGAVSATYRANVTGRYTVQVVLACAGPPSSALTLVQRAREAPTVAQTGLTLTSSAPAGNQWFLNGVAIAGATSQTIVSDRTGRYSVRANPSGCGETLSDELYIAILAVEEETPGLLRVYPNPAQRFATVEWTPPGPLSAAPVVELTDGRGVVVASEVMQRSGKLFKVVVSLDRLAAGLFFVVIESSQGRTTPQKLVKW
jgi:hypothetical protein